MQTLVIHLPDTGKSPASPSAEVRFTLTPTALAVELNTSAECRSSASAFNHVSTAAEPGNNVDSLTWAALKRYQFRYKYQ